MVGVGVGEWWVLCGGGWFLHINRSMVTFKGSIRYWNYLETCTDSVPAVSRQLMLSVRNCVMRDPINSGLTRLRVLQA